MAAAAPPPATGQLPLMPQFYPEDTVITDDAGTIGIVEKTWHHVSNDDSMDLSETTVDGAPEIVDYYYDNGLPPRGWSVVAQALDTRIMPDGALRLMDRSFAIGDLCKRSPSARQSGSVKSVSMTVTLQHTLTNQVVHNVPGDEIDLYLQPEIGQYFSDNGARVAEIGKLWCKAAVQLQNGAIAWVDYLSDDGQIFSGIETIVPESTSTVAPPGGVAPSLIATATEHLFPHQTVKLERQLLAGANFLYGVYSPSLSPVGKVLASKVVSSDVNWLLSGYQGWAHYDGDFTNDYKIFTDEMDNANWTVGDRVVFRRGADAFRDYGMERVGRERYGGFDVNCLIVAATHTTVTVEWQDLTTEVLPARDLVPYLEVDEHDVWPGEYVGLKDMTRPSTEFVNTEMDYTKIGVAQQVDAEQRTVRVRWFKDRDNLSPDELEDEAAAEEVSFYQLVPHPLVSFAVGDYVYLPHALYLTEGRLRTTLENQPNSGVIASFARSLLSQGNQGLASLARSILPRFNSATPSDADTLTPSTPADGTPTPSTPAPAEEEDAAVAESKECDWYGQITALHLDGTVSVRLGLTRPVKTVVLPANVLVAPQDDAGDDDYDDQYDEDDVSDDYSHGHSHSMDLDDEYHPRPRGIPLPPAAPEESDSSWEDASDEGEDVDDDDDDEMAEAEPAKPAEAPAAAEPAAAPAAAPAPVPPPLSRNVSAVSDIDLDDDAPPRFLILDDEPGVDHHYANVAPSKINHRRLAKERKILTSSLPEGIYVRTYANRLDLMRALIVGSDGTPYEKAPFLIDIHIGSSFPHEPPECYFHSWNTNGIGRVNPNLYEDGKICLSLLGTWPGDEQHELWDPERSSILQVLVSLQALVLNKEPYFNEAGFEAIHGTEASAVNAMIYYERTFILSRGFVLYALSHDIREFAAVVRHLYYTRGMLRFIVDWEREILDAPPAATDAPPAERIARVTNGARVLLRSNYTALRAILDRAA
ncbi:uncharacterized protein V1510DRAFT_403953 [Dipodascopsis tothii]|uniref:uncharacterized protein n=1 Tax=Dipodascopsis tothii TaxID=44089 RepID=UPI0034CF1BAB